MEDFYCAAPFRQIYIDSSGISPCCRIPRQHTTLKEWPDSTFLKELQQQTLTEQWPNLCNSCQREEKLYNTSLRIQSNANYELKHKNTLIDFIDYRSENLCNFRCRSCEPQFSHLIAKELQDNPEILSKFFPGNQKKHVTVDETNYKWIIDNLGQIKRLMFTGGEPTVIPQVKIMLTEILKNQYQDLLIMITTNGSFQDNFWYDLTKKLPNLHWTLSIDAIGTAANIIRNGSDWAQIEYNANWLAKNSNSFMINSVISNLSLFQLWPLLNFVKILKQQSNGTNGCDHRFHIINGPPSRIRNHLSVQNLSEQLRTQAIDYLIQCRSQHWEPDTINMLDGLLEQIKNSIFNQDQWKKTQEYNQELDRLRGQDHTQLFVAQYPG